MILPNRAGSRLPACLGMSTQTDIKNAPPGAQGEIKTSGSDAAVSPAVVDRSDATERRQEHTWRDNLNIGIAVLGLVIIAIQAWIMFRQTELMTNQTNIMDQTLRVSERAYVGIASLSVNWEEREVVVMLQNIGNVPAKAIKLQAEEVRATPSTDITTGSKVYDKLDGSTFPWDAGDVQLFPGTPMRVAIPLRGFRPEEVDAISKKRERVYIGGKIEYDDGFGKIDSTVFAFEYNPPPNEGWTAHSDLSRFFKQN
jgi:hypothetical protein